MFDSAILDVAIGLAFIFLLISLLVTAASEMLSGWLKWRSTHLWDGLERLLQSAEARNALYSHPLIKGLARVDIQRPDWNQGRNGPSYIPSRTFALALIDVLRRPHKVADDLEQRLRAAVTNISDPAKALASLKELIAEVKASDAPEGIKADLRGLEARVLAAVDPNVLNDLKMQVRSAIDRVPEQERAAAAAAVTEWLAQGADGAGTYIDLRAALVNAINGIPFAGVASATEQLRAALTTIADNFAPGKLDDAIREVQAFAQGAARRWLRDASGEMQETVEALSPLLNDAADDIDKFRENIEIWFNDGMERVSGWYKRHIAVVHTVIALLLAIAMNVDALQITRTLWREPTLRQSLVANATRFAEERETDVADPPLESTAVADGRPALSVKTDNVRLFPEDVARFQITFATPATKDTTISVERNASGILLSPTNGDFAGDPLTLKPAENAQAAEFFVKAANVPSVTLVRLRVAKGNLEASPGVVVTPEGDERFAAIREEIGTLGLPIGWSCPSSAQVTADSTAIGGPFWCSTPLGNSGHRWRSLSWWSVWFKDIFAMVLGWMITAAAASLGAPFWFDTLKRVISIRASGKAPEERPLSPKEVSQPREPGQRPRDADLLNALKR